MWEIGGVRKGMHKGRSGAGNMEPKGGGAGRKDEPGKRDALFIGDLELAAADIDLGGDAAIFQGHATVAPPRGRLELELMRRGLARQYRREQYAVVSQTRLVADHRDRIAPLGHFRQFVDQTRSR